ncbi:hypothetical protein KC318_g27 [Hortaea werneckii]|nr:hypothetical protein KC318_g27 [Hortaea werneckii]
MNDSLPPLRFEDGDVIIKLSADHNRHLLVHSDVIRAGLPTLGPVLKPVWNVPQTINHPLTGRQIDVYGLALKSVEHTILLEGKGTSSFQDPILQLRAGQRFATTNCSASVQRS